MITKKKDKVLVGIQIILFGLYLIPLKEFSVQLPLWISFMGLMIGLCGWIPVIMALIVLNENISPFPTPKESAVLVQHGIFKYVRHPIYTGILISCYGFGFYKANFIQISIATLLLLLFIYKARYEEMLLEKKFNNYSAYKKKTGMFLPLMRRGS
jgi:protein-S-isoprenylcysteine O-methyltransferase Ste14